MYLLKPFWKQAMAIDHDKLTSAESEKKSRNQNIAWKTFGNINLFYVSTWRGNVLTQARSYLSTIRMDNFCARALQSEVFPVPGGPGEYCKDLMNIHISNLALWEWILAKLEKGQKDCGQSHTREAGQISCLRLKFWVQNLLFTFEIWRAILNQPRFCESCTTV